ncbi:MULTISPECIES: anti-phage deoxyguanosine triphosphatase [unclassified Thalassotalea]|uniref:anti-phage deoxyguanosine triphosphatase n=1 Tax=unclassified Thalassotalea TaxID=2614972 RepID=UPI0010805A74|nr:MULTISPECIES: anti-phage deoxyguanosine triphosphatase [unclassified Thalassotalea]NMP15626.1 deoxyguanosinetriphosphate triphosphohydrolase family protein [Thalassotalea sp. Y01]QBY05730.1 deoxyguanosinetriphosphate triphosphohydrolase family protein [Thalassotalea sp. HSM 43]
MNENWLQRQDQGTRSRVLDHRSPFQRDRARILHSAAFRRLQSKTQVMGVGQSDFYRTRLTHSLEAAQIGSGICAQLRNKYPTLSQQLLPTEDALIEAVCLAHDIGHPPFGHGGEVALNFMMHNFGGFEGNGQTFRIVTKLEPYTEHFGMNLTRRTLLGLIKYPQVVERLANQQAQTPPVNFRQLKAGDWHPPKGLYKDDLKIIDWVLAPLSEKDRNEFQKVIVNGNGHHKTCYKSLDCSIMELADDIAYGIHDMEDAIVTRVVSRESFEQNVVRPLSELDDEFLNKHTTAIFEKLFSYKRYLQKDAIGMLVNYLITHIELQDLNDSIGTNFQEPLLRYNAALPAKQAQALKIFKDYVYKFVIKQPDIQRMEYKGQQIVMELFEAFASDPARLLPISTNERWQVACQQGENPHRVIADYLSGMTDEHAIRVYDSLFLSQGLNKSQDLY